MENTPNLGLKKPGLEDYVNINDLNDNMDVLDEEVEAKMPKSGGAFGGIVQAHNNTSHNVRQIRNIILSNADPTPEQMREGEVWLKFR